VVDQFKYVCLPRLPPLESCLIHNDANDHNVVLDASASRVLGIIDFGDMVYAPRIVELAVTITYGWLPISRLFDR
jgi:hydroxylysine kinase